VIVLNHPIPNRIGNSGIANPRMPVLNGQLACDDGGLVAQAHQNPALNHLRGNTGWSWQNQTASGSTMKWWCLV